MIESKPDLWISEGWGGRFYRRPTRAEVLAYARAEDMIDWAAAYEAGSGGHEHEHESWVEGVLDAALEVSDDST